MLPKALEYMRKSLNEKSDRSSTEEDVLGELRAVSRALDEAGLLRKSITEGFDTRAYKMWGPDPGRCSLCGK